MLHHLAACKAHVAAFGRAKSSTLVAGLPVIFININMPFGREPSPEMMCPVNQRSMIAYSAVQREIGFNDRPRLTGGPV